MPVTRLAAVTSPSLIRALRAIRQTLDSRKTDLGSAVFAEDDSISFITLAIRGVILKKWEQKLPVYSYAKNEYIGKYGNNFRSLREK
jgi:hypothetical protein